MSDNLPDELSKEIVIARDGITIGGRRFPGVIAASSVYVTPPDVDDPVWSVNLRLITETPVRFVGIRLDAFGEIVLEDDQ